VDWGLIAAGVSGACRCFRDRNGSWVLCDVLEDQALVELEIISGASG
jgi:hypothetical protein